MRRIHKASASCISAAVSSKGRAKTPSDFFLNRPQRFSTFELYLSTSIIFSILITELVLIVGPDKECVTTGGFFMSSREA